MYLEYANLIHFSNSLVYNNMFEARLYNSILNWVGEAQDIIDENYYFTVEYSFNLIGIAVEAGIKVQRKVDEEWITLGTFAPDGPTLSSIIATVIPCEDRCIPSDIPSDPLHYYVPNYYVTGYYV